jgi:hypothetical protein
MPRKLELNSFNSDLEAVKSLYDDAIKYGDVFAELQYKDKIKDIKHRITELNEVFSPKASVALFFGGEPVIGSKGIEASFAGSALESFQGLINKLFASKVNGGLNLKGKIPLTSNSNLMITHVAKGSFGFILDELTDQDQIMDTQLKDVVFSATDLIEKSSLPNSLAFEEIVESLDSRILKSLREFFVTLDKNKASVRLVNDLHEFSLDFDSIHRGRLRTEATIINEEEIYMDVIINGLLPETCKFEATTDDGVLIYGSVLKSVVEQYKKIANSTDVIDKKWKVKMIEKKITPLQKEEKIIYRLTQLVSAI